MPEHYMTPHARQLLLNTGGSPDAGPLGQLSLEQRTAQDLGASQAMSQDHLSAINQFYQDPARQDEINRAVNAGLGQAMAGLEQQIREQARQQAFARARSGNIGGSVQAGQQAGLQAAAQLGTMQNVATAEQQRDMLQRQLLQQQQQEALGTFGMDPFIQQMINERLSGLGVQDSRNAALFGLDQQRASQEAFANDELSRGIGNMFNIGGQMFTLDQRAKMLGRQGLFGGQ